jgi:hypothetical protein
MTVEILSLSGMAAAAATAAATALLDIDSGSGPDRLDRLLVIDDTAMLGEHADVYPQIENSNRVERLLCVTVGPRPDGSWKLSLPGNLGGNQGTPVLWVSRPAGIDWRVAKAAKASRHAGATAGTVDHQHPLVKLLVLDEVFDKILEVMEGFPHRAASPGLWLAGADDEAATFAGALAVAIRRVSEPGPGLDGPFRELLPDRAGGARLAENGPLARHLDRLGESDREIARELDGKSGLGGMLRRGDGDLPRHVARVGEALASLRDLVDRLLREAHVPAGTAVPGGAAPLESRQRSLVRNAGLEFEAEMMPRPPAGAALPAEETLTYRAVAGAIRGGDSIPLAGKRLMATEHQVARHGSDKYRPRVAQLCPQELIETLAAAPRKTPRGDIGKVRHELGIDEATAAAQALLALVIDVANREWSPTAVAPAELVRVRAALDGTGKALAEYARAAGAARGGVRAARAARLGDSLLPVLREFIVDQVAAEMAAPSANGPEALRAAQGRAAALLASWAAHVQAHGVTALPPFAGDLALVGAHSIEEDVATVREALLYPVREEMWQLCAPGDLSALDVDADAASIRFASRLNERALAGLPGGEPVWTSSGTLAGQLRLVPLRAGVAESTWGIADPAGPQAVMES